MSEFNLYLLRHGELVQKDILCGRTDIALSDLGKQQLIAATNKLPKISSCYSSPLRRCRIFAEEYCQQHELALQVSSQLQEMDFGDWDGKRYQTLWQAQASSDEESPTLGAFWQNPWRCLPPNGESMESFTERVEHFWRNLLAEFHQTAHGNNNEQNILVLSHGGVIRYLLAKVLQLPIPGTTHMTNIDVPYGALIHIQILIDSEGKAWPKLML
ncbi:MAG: histidine phosphatase family protein [Colwellia sp.]|nr:histidine phosphatase family protein [Colwellia sp.]MCW8865263.1 histidine phosphatase family protein [Colwellia sp.]MCW9082691.1 histidine phosphatase family protein [Colwellia sp.]